ncbi:hypothetical protein DXG01_002350 [Tephrocybe rancida]|nr:hypothetical protein DXG01_002350 [Tephrocybe rancida]
MSRSTSHTSPRPAPIPAPSAEESVVVLRERLYLAFMVLFIGFIIGNIIHVPIGPPPGKPCEPPQYLLGLLAILLVSLHMYVSKAAIWDTSFTVPANQLAQSARSGHLVQRLQSQIHGTRESLAVWAEQDAELRAIEKRVEESRQNMDYFLGKVMEAQERTLEMLKE